MIKNTQGFIRHPWCLLSANADSENKGQGRKKTRDIVNSVGKIDSNKRSGETKVPRYDYNKRKKKGRDARERRRNIERRKFATEVQ